MNKNNSLAFSLVVLVSGVIIGGGIFLARTNFIENKTPKTENPKELTYNVQPITEEDHILGKPDADVLIIEYADFECPFCREFHTTMRRVLDEYGSQGRVAWVFRHSPVTASQENSNSKRISLVSECIAKFGTESDFWKFTNEIYDNHPESTIKENTDFIIEKLGFNSEEINKCTSDQDVISKVERDIKDTDFFRKDMLDFGTPYNILITKSGTTNIAEPIPYILLKDIIEKNSYQDTE